MDQLEATKYRILRYLNEHHVRQNENLTEEAIRNYFYDINGTTYYNTAFEELAANRLIDQTSSNLQWKIQPVGEIELNRLQNSIDLEKNIEATTNLVQSAKDDKKGIKWNRRLTLFASFATLVIAGAQFYASRNANEIMDKQREIQEKQYEHQAKLDSISRLYLPPDTIYTISPLDSSNNKIGRKNKK